MPEERVFQSEFNEDSSIDLESEAESLELIAQEDEDVDYMEEMKPAWRIALLEFRCRVEDAILGNYILGKNGGKSFSDGIEKSSENLTDISLWGVPLLPSKGHKGTDLVLMKFLKVKDFKVADAFENLKKTLKWRREMEIEGILGERFSPNLEDLGYIKGTDKGGRPLCYCLYGNFKDRELYKKIFETEENCKALLRWRIQFMEKCIRTLTFKPGEPDSIIQIIDLKNIGPAIKHIRSIARRWLFLFQEHYPGIVFKCIIIYVPLWVFAFHALNLKFLTQRTKKKLVLVRPTRVTETLLKFIGPESLPIQYGGLKRDNDDEFSEDDKVLEQNFKGGSTDFIEIYVAQAGETVIWDASVVGNEVSYKEEFIPDDECSYNVLLRKEKRLMTSVRNSFHIREPGKIVITIENRTYKRKRIYYRFKTKPTVPIYGLSK